MIKSEDWVIAIPLNSFTGKKYHMMEISLLTIVINQSLKGNNDDTVRYSEA